MIVEMRSKRPRRMWSAWAPIDTPSGSPTLGVLLAVFQLETRSGDVHEFRKVAS